MAMLWYAPRLPNLLAFTMRLLGWPTLADTRPGAVLVLDWRGQHLQRPRTNNSGALATAMAAAAAER